MANDLPAPKSEPVNLEKGMVIRFDNIWTIEVGGGQQPRWTAKGETLEECIGDLVTKTSEDAIQDEAIEWGNHIQASLV